MAKGSPKLSRFTQTTSATQKKSSPKCSGAKRSGSSPRVKQRADWNPFLEKSLVDILHEYKENGYRGDNGCWKSEGWNKMVKEFHLRNKSVSFTKVQIQEKEGQLKRDYKMLKAARMHSGSKWNEIRNMVEGPPSMWDNLIVTFPKIKKFRNNKASFPLFDQLGELYGDPMVEGNYNFTSLQSQHETHEEEPLQEIHDVEDDAHTEEEPLQEIHEVRDEDDEGTEATDEEERAREKDTRNEESEAPPVERSGQRRTAASRKEPEKEEEQMSRKRAKIESMMGLFLEMRTKEAEDDAAEIAREKEASKGDDFSIKRCISVINTMEVTKVEKAKAYAVFTKSKENREAFICASEADQEAALIWLRNEMS